jgi:gamma-glutamyltranspeptidase/glutathione hydrolase
MAVNTGILLNNRMSYWHLEHGHPNRLQPGRRVRHKMNPPLVLKDGAPWCVFGTPGADNQVQINLQVLSAMIDFGLDPSSPPKCRAGPRMSPANTPTGRMTARMR